MTPAGELKAVREVGGPLGWQAPTGVVLFASEDALRGVRPGRDLLWRAVLSGAAKVVDATAGLGGDAFHLAAKGAEVTMIERSPLLLALLEDALERAAAGELGSVAAAAAERLRLIRGDARAVLQERQRLAASEVVYLDPMFPATTKRSLPSKELALLRSLLPPSQPAEEAELLSVARAVATRRVVVKRPAGAPALAGERPSGALLGSTTRYDIYAPRS